MKNVLINGKKPMPSSEFLHQCFVLTESGELFWKWRPRKHFATNKGQNIFNNEFAGKKAGGIDRGGYLLIQFQINSNPLDNRPSNLRPCTHSENGGNMSLSKANASGFKGVFWHTQSETWRAKITVRGSRKHLGNFHTPQAAHRAYCEAAQNAFGPFANGGAPSAH